MSMLLTSRLVQSFGNWYGPVMRKSLNDMVGNRQRMIDLMIDDNPRIRRELETFSEVDWLRAWVEFTKILEKREEEFYRARATNLPVSQLETAYALAYAHDHEWASVIAIISRDSGNDPKSPRLTPMSPDAISSVVELTAHDGAMSGIDSPHVVDGVIRHETMTGRLRWSVYPSGEAEITVSRPEGDVLKASYTRGSVITVERLNPDIAVYERHREALRVAIDALRADVVMPNEITYLPDQNERVV